VYRLERLQDVVDLALDELGGDGAVLVIEWGDAVEELLGSDLLRVEITTVDDGEVRVLRVDGEGPAWETRTHALAAALDPWEVAG
jgi:tRNA A37 threonylcarbamoyladenosine biosynthesis protein TsaE